MHHVDAHRPGGRLEVGGEPALFGVSAAEFHERAATRARLWPHAMVTLSTHDTKRSEDVRARIAATPGLRDAVQRHSRAFCSNGFMYLLDRATLITIVDKRDAQAFGVTIINNVSTI